VLDEPTHNLDAEAIQELARVLRERLPSLVRQVLLITHEERLEAAVSGYLYRFHRNKAREEPTVVEQISLPERF
jgi:DNA repair exonuclease SbcCD ATPase subunit